MYELIIFTAIMHNALLNAFDKRFIDIKFSNKMFTVKEKRCIMCSRKKLFKTELTFARS